MTREGRITAGAIRQMGGDELIELVNDCLDRLGEDELLAVLGNRYCTSQLCLLVASHPRASSSYRIRARLVEHRATPQAHALKFVHYLYWPDLLRISIDVRVPPAVRRAVDKQLVTKIQKMALGEKMAAARRCSRELVKVLLFDPSPRVFRELLINQRLQEEDLVALLATDHVTVEKLTMTANHAKWSSRYSVRIALVKNASTPRGIAASQLRFLRAVDLRALHDDVQTSVYLRRCIERQMSSGIRPR
ncbi:MAG TPA: hypothetical protein VMT00_04990 [Thermoanaerobaculia bacterium]|nr:hypothetical protein [Thermoanaerobaculia bacterium]